MSKTPWATMSSRIRTIPSDTGEVLQEEFQGGDPANGSRHSRTSASPSTDKRWRWTGRSTLGSSYHSCAATWPARPYEPSFISAVTWRVSNHRRTAPDSKDASTKTSSTPSSARNQRRLCSARGRDRCWIGFNIRERIPSQFVRQCSQWQCDEQRKRPQCQ